MKAFSDVYRQLELQTASVKKAELVKSYLSTAKDADKIRMLALYTGRKPKSVFSLVALKELAMEMAGCPHWLFDECSKAVGDLSETIALILPAPTAIKTITLTDVFDVWHLMLEADADHRKILLLGLWDSLETYERFLLNKLLTGSFRSNVNEGIIISALSSLTSIDEWKLRLRLQRKWSPDDFTFQELVFKEVDGESAAKPFQWCPFTPYEAPLADLGEEHLWRVDLQPEGMRLQIIKRDGEVFIWSATGDLINPLFPEIKSVISECKNSFVMTGLMIAFKADKFLPIQFLEKRLKAKKASKILMNEVPIIFVADDLFEWETQDMTPQPLVLRLEKLSLLVQTINNIHFLMSEPVVLNFQEERIQGAGSVFSGDAYMLRKLAAGYSQEGEPTYLWNLKSDPLSIIGVLIYVQSGNPGSGGVAVEFTFAVWKEELLIPVAKIRPENLSHGEMQQINAFVKGNVVEKFGPVRSIVPDLVFEIGFEKVRQSKRHKSGLILQSPRIIKWLPDEPVQRAHTLDDLLGMISG